MLLEIVHRYKYHRALWFEPFLADLLLRPALSALRTETWDLIMPVPLHPLKKSEREFNQAERLALHLSRVTQIPLNAHALQRVVPTKTQTMLSRRERAANVRQAFVLRHRDGLSGKRIVLVDDVLTTGATASACAKVLLAAAVERVAVWTLARGV
jgi:ComF family protein